MAHLGKMVFKKELVLNIHNTQYRQNSFGDMAILMGTVYFWTTTYNIKTYVIFKIKNQVKDLTNKSPCRKLKTHILVLVQM